MGLFQRAWPRTQKHSVRFKNGRTLLTVGIALFSALACWGCDLGAERKTTRPQSPAPAFPRVVSLSPTASQFLASLGAADRVIAVDPDSAALPEYAQTPVFNPDRHITDSPDWVLVSRGESETSTRQWAGPETGVIEWDPQNLEDVYGLYRTLGASLLGPAEALRQEVRLARPLAAIGGESFGQPRLRTIAVTRLEPLELAGAHSFETDLIEIGGGESLTHTHGDDTFRVATPPQRLAELAPELILVMTPEPLPREAQALALKELSPYGPVEFVHLDVKNFWLDSPVETARAMRDLIRSRSANTERPLKRQN